MTDTYVETSDVDATADESRTIVAPFELLRSDDADGLTLTGYAAVFNSPTRINSWEGDFTEVIAPGAFRHTIRNNRPIMQYDHGQHPLIGSLPVASIRRIKEDARGLYVEARVFDNWLTEPLRDAIRDQAISGMSFRFAPVKESWSPDGDVRTLHEVKLYELGPVAWPAYADTSVALRSLERVAGIKIISSPEPPADALGSDDGPASIDPAEGQSAHLTQLRARALRLRSLTFKEKA
jgi:HK97 family phage prohead protease